MRRPALLALACAVAAPAAAPGYIAVPANRLTLCEVMLEFPTVAVLELDRADEAAGAARFAVVEVVQGKSPGAAVRVGLRDGDAIPPRLRGMTKGAKVVAFFGSPDNRTLMFGPGGWFLTRPDQGWERFAQFRDDFDALFVGTPVELAAAARTLSRGGAATVPVRPAGVAKGERLLVRYDADFPHRRRPVPDKDGAPGNLAVVLRLLASPSVATRYQAVQFLRFHDADDALRKALADPHPDVRAAAAFVLGERPSRPPAVVRDLAARLKDNDRFVCANAAWALGRGEKEAEAAVPDLLAALADRNFDHDFRPHRAAEAAEAILALAPGTPAADRAVQFFLSDRMLRDHRIDSEGTRTAAARALGRSKGAAKAALPELRKALADPLPATRVAAAEAVILVGGAPDAAALKVVAAEIGRGEPATRIQAMRVATVQTAEAFLPALDAAAADPTADPAVRAEARATAADLRRRGGR